MELKLTCENFLVARRIGAVPIFCFTSDAFFARMETTGLGSRQSGSAVLRTNCDSSASLSSGVCGCAWSGNKKINIF